MKYDDASWHYEGTYPADLPYENAATHIGMFLAWAIGRGLASEFFSEECPEDLAGLERRELTPGRFALRVIEGKLCEDELSELGNRFAEAYYPKRYARDYERVFGADPEQGTYRVEDTWENFACIAAVLDGRYEEWRSRT